MTELAKHISLVDEISAENADGTDSRESVYGFRETSALIVELRFLVRGLAVITFLLVVASTVTQYLYISTGYSSAAYGRLVKIFSVDLEMNVPTFFSMLLFLTASLLLAFVAVHHFKSKARHKWSWTILSVGFLLMAFDEIVAAHERTVEPLRALLGGENLGIFYFAWVVPAIGLVLFLALVFLNFWLKLPARTRWIFLIGGVIFLSGTIGMELIDGRYAEVHGTNNMTYMFMTTLEETLEMTGIVVFIGGLLDYISRHYDGIRMRLSNQD